MWWFNLSVVLNSATPWTLAHQAPLFMGFPRRDYWNGLPWPPPGDLPDPWIKTGSPALKTDCLLELAPFTWHSSFKVNPYCNKYQYFIPFYGQERCWSWNSNTLATSGEELTHWKRPWCWEGLGAGGEGDNRGWDGWMALPTRWAWVWVNSGSWWWTGRPGVLRFMGSQRVGHDWATELNWIFIAIHFSLSIALTACNKVLACVVIFIDFGVFSVFFVILIWPIDYLEVYCLIFTYLWMSQIN